MLIYFGLGLDEDIHIPDLVQDGAAIDYVGPQRLLAWLEARLGFQGYPSGTEYLRIEQYRQLISKYLEEQPEAFYRASFEADQLATAAELLSRRDELLLANWDFTPAPDMPERLQVLAELEQHLRVEYIVNTPPDSDTVWIELSAGFADRFVQVMDFAAHRNTTISEIRLLEPLDILPHHYQRLFTVLAKRDIKITNAEEFKDLSHLAIADTDLGKLQRRLDTQDGTSELQADGSLLLLKSKRETTAAAYLAKLFQKNPKLRPTILISDKNRTLDNAFLQDSLPSLGILSASSARPSLQILKLVTAFLWEPLDPFKLMEFVTLKVKPLEEGLAIQIARRLSETPGINSIAWKITISRYFEEIETAAATDNSIDVNAIREQYNFWFQRQRYNTSQTVPKEEAVEIYRYLGEWAYQQFEYTSGRNQSMLVLSEQAKRVEELLDTTPESDLSYLELERIIRTIYEPSPVQFREQELGFYPFLHHSAAFVDAVDELVWWNFIQAEPNHFFSRWYKRERTYLTEKKVALDTPKDENKRLIWQRTQPILHARNRVLLIVPSLIEGKVVHEHPLQSDLKATFGDLDAITLDMDTQAGQAQFEQFFDMPEQVALDTYTLGRPQSFIEIPSLNEYLQTDYETFTSLNTLFYYPYQWVFKYKTRLTKSSILSVVKDTTLLGNLAHRFFEEMLKAEGISTWERKNVDQWIDKRAPSLFRQEGAVLLMYGREPDKINFLNRIKYSAWSLVNSLQKNEWTVKDTEMNMEDLFVDVPVRAKADLVLQRNDEFAVLDLKWRGIYYRQAMIKNQEDLQLVLYSRLLEKAEDCWAHTAYFIIEKGHMIARNNQAFQEVSPIDPESDHRAVHQTILTKMEETYSWRQVQVKRGLIEVRCQYTKDGLEDAYYEYSLPPNSMEHLEMKDKDAPFDDYRALINLVT